MNCGTLLHITYSMQLKIYLIAQLIIASFITYMDVYVACMLWKEWKKKLD